MKSFKVLEFLKCYQLNIKKKFSYFIRPWKQKVEPCCNAEGMLEDMETPISFFDRMRNFAAHSA